MSDDNVMPFLRGLVLGCLIGWVVSVAVFTLFQMPVSLLLWTVGVAIVVVACVIVLVWVVERGDE